MPFEGRLKECPPSWLEDDHLVRTERLDAPGQKKVVIKFGWSIAEDLGGDESPRVPRTKDGSVPTHPTRSRWFGVASIGQVEPNDVDDRATRLSK